MAEASYYIIEGEERPSHRVRAALIRRSRISSFELPDDPEDLDSPEAIEAGSVSIILVKKFAKSNVGGSDENIVGRAIIDKQPKNIYEFSAALFNCNKQTQSINQVFKRSQ
uniref:Uncharacterized protein n=1 Tax=Glossina pallidipes TaxID=7398 RepID=A0A1A9ZQJ8_GLOPL